MVSAIAAVAILAGALPASAGGYGREQRPALVTFGGPTATVVESPDGGFEITMDEVFPFAAYSYVPRPLRSGARVPVDFATALVDREGIEALLLRPDAERSEDALLVELTNTSLTPEGRFTAHATVVDEADDPLLGRAASGVDRRLGDAPEPLWVRVADPEGEMGDVVPAPRGIQVADTDYDVVSNNIFGYTPLPDRLVYTPVAGSDTCVKEFKTRQTDDFTDNWIILRGFTVDSSFACWFQPSKASYTVTVGDRTLNLEVEQESVTNSNFKVNRCDGAGLVCKGSNGVKQFTINIFRT